MSACYKFRRGLDIPLKGSAHLMTAPLASSSLYTLKPGDFKNTIPKLLVREGDIVQAGSPVYCDKEHPEILFTAPVSGTIHAIVRGEKRKITGVQILADEEQMQELFPVADPEQITPERIRELLLQSGCWPLITRRPYGTPAHPGETPKAIYISCFDSAPLAPHYDFTFAESFESLLMGIRVLERLCPGKVHLGLRDTTSPHSVFRRLPGIMHTFSGPHPAGNPGVQLHHVCPVG